VSAQMTRTTLKKLGTYYLALFIWLFTSAMHIPDGYLSPATSLIMFLLVLPFWGMGVRKIRQKMNARSVPLISLMAAFSFVIMMFNIPLPGGTTGHAVGAALAAIVLGPEVAVIAVSIALIIQAFFFGDGGILALGANCFNMAVVIPYVSSAVYQAFAKGTEIRSPRRPIGAAIGGWLGLTAAAFFTAVQFGIQPLLFTAADGTPLYAPYPLSVSLPAMLVPHMLAASIIEGMMTALIILYLQRSNAQVLEAAGGGSGREVNLPKLRWLWVGLAVLVVASPLGLLAPGTAWGEWSIEELAKLGLKSIPAGLEKLSEIWGAPMADYKLSAIGNANVGYILSALVGILLVGIMAWLFTLVAAGGSGRPKKSI
jgi:cobalt/nickel transport system permease protein